MLKAKKTFSLLLSVVLAVTMLGVWPVASVNAESTQYESLTAVPAGYTAIQTAEELSEIRDANAGKYILMNDIDLSDYTASGTGWNPIGTADNPFTGILDGNGYKITGLKFFLPSSTEESYTGGLFGYVSDGEVTNLELQATYNLTVSRAGNSIVFGGLVGQAQKIHLANCKVNIQGTALSETLTIGGLIGINDCKFDDQTGSDNATDKTAIIEDCSVSGSIAGTGGTYTLGGLVGHGRDIRISDSTNSASINGIATLYENIDYAGGIAGSAMAYQISGCTNNGKITSDTDPIQWDATTVASGITNEVGTVYNKDSEALSKTILNTVNNGAICLSAGGYVSGILDRGPSTPFSISNCQNNGSLTCEGNVAGIVSELYNGSVENCFNTGSLFAENGVSGITTKNQLGNISGCYNIGRLEGGNNASGITMMNLDLIENCYNAGQVSADYAAGISLYNSSYALIDNTYNIGGVESIEISPAGIAGQNDAVVGNTYYYANTEEGVADNEIVGIDDSEKIYLDQLDDQETYDGFDFGDDQNVSETSGLYKSTAATTGIWQMSASSGLPKLTKTKEIYVTGISIVQKPRKIMYLVDEKISTSGIVVKVNYSNGKTLYINKGLAVSSYKKTVGTRNIKISYGGKIATFPVTYSTFRASSNSSNSVKLSWNGVSKATKYRIYRATSSSGTYKLIGTASKSARSYMDKSLTAGKNYYYKIRPMYGTKNGSLSSYKSAKPIPCAPSFSATCDGNSTVALAWKDVDGANYYQVYRATSLGGTYTLLKTINGFKYNDKSTTFGKTYYYKIRAVNVRGKTKTYGNFTLPKKVLR